MTHDIDHPLVTFGLFAFNQEKFVEAAMDAAFAQTYSPLEIILSDDCSNDATFSRMEAAAARYSGSHEIRLNRNETNLGIGAHVNRVEQLSRGQFFVAAAADDISKPERTRVLTEAWLHQNKCAGYFHSAYEEMSEEGAILRVKNIGNVRHELRTFIQKNLVKGATEAWSREVFEVFGPLHPDLMHEDRILAFRAAILGGVHYIDSPMVAYRLGGVSGPQKHQTKLAARRVNAIRYISEMAQFIGDTELARRKGLLTDSASTELIAVASDRISRELLLVRSTSLAKAVIASLLDLVALVKRVGFVVYKLFSR